MRHQAFLGSLVFAISTMLHAHAPLRVMSFPGGANLPLWVAEDRGMFARQRLDVSVSPAPNSVELFRDLAAGQQDVAMAAFDNVVAYQEGQGEVELSTTPDFFAFMGITRGTLRLVVSPSITEYDDLRGKTLGVDAVTTGYSLVLRKLLQHGGLKEGDYQLISVGGTQARAQRLMEDKFSGAILTTPLELLPESRGYRRLANAADVLGPYQSIVGISRRRWAARNKDTLVRFIRASTEAIDWLFDPGNRREAAAIYQRHSPSSSEDAALRDVNALLDEREGFSRRGQLDSEGMMTVLRIRSELGTPHKSVTEPSRYIDQRFQMAAAARF
jgi:ABC-type nitrate/sulfonate/bicarbonate transport system substrate-binding protein